MLETIKQRSEYFRKVLFVSLEDIKPSPQPSYRRVQKHLNSSISIRMPTKQAVQLVPLAGNCICDLG